MANTLNVKDKNQTFLLDSRLTRMVTLHID